MSKIVEFRSRHKQRPAKTMSFATLFAVAMIGSFALGAGASHFIAQNGAVVQPSASGSNIVAIYGGGTKKIEQPGKFTGTYRHCAGGKRVNCVVDGDTLWSNGVKIRVADIDTPEVSQPGCAAEKALGDRATVRLMELVNAGPFQMQEIPGRDADGYGRKLRVLIRNGQSLGDVLVSEGLARTWTGRRQPWC